MEGDFRNRFRPAGALDRKVNQAKGKVRAFMEEWQKFTETYRFSLDDIANICLVAYKTFSTNREPNVACGTVYVTQTSFTKNAVNSGLQRFSEGNNPPPFLYFIANHPDKFFQACEKKIKNSGAHDPSIQEETRRSITATLNEAIAEVAENKKKSGARR